jgi:hypothetical protein
VSHWINVIAFQTGWFASILSAANGMPWIAALAALAVTVFHLALARQPREELRLVLVATLIGALWENALALAGWVGFSDGVVVDSTAPLWMVAQWAMFATTLNLSLSWLKGRLFLAALLGAVGAPLSYAAGERLGALQILDRDAALIALALGWAVMTPLLLVLARRWNGYAIASNPSPVARVQHA